MENDLQTIDFWKLSDEDKKSVYFEIKERKNVHPKAAEKDWWVCHVIQALFQVRCADALTFKGGTSLSKAWGITERFSEDVDIAFDKSFFGLGGDTRSSRDRIRKLTRGYVADELAPELLSILWASGAMECSVAYLPRKDSDADPTALVVDYHSILPKEPYIQERIRIEFSSRSPREPREMREIRPFAAELSPLIEFAPTSIPTVTPTRTFLEKVFLLHEEFQKDYPRYRRMSRHLYDLYCLDRSGWREKAAADPELFQSLVRHRSTYSAMRGIDYAGHRPGQLHILPPDDKMSLWEEDYRFMREQFIYGEAPSWEELLDAIRAIQEKV